MKLRIRRIKKVNKKSKVKSVKKQTADYEAKYRAEEYDGAELAKKRVQLKKKRKILKLKRRFIIFVFFFACISVTAIIFKAPFFDISEVICVGQERLTEEELLKAADIKTGENIFISNIGKIKERIAKIPYVSEYNARRIFPDKIKIWVRESVPAAVIEDGGKNIICDDESKVLEFEEAKNNGAEKNKEDKENAENTENDKNEENIKNSEKSLCVLKGVEKREAVLGEKYIAEDDLTGKKIIECMKILKNLDMLNNTNYIDFSDISDIIIMYDERLRIKIGNTNEMEYKLKFIDKVIKENISDYEKATVDYTGEKLYIGQFEQEAYEEKTEEKSEKNVAGEKSASSES